MKLTKVSIAVLFLSATFTSVYGQRKDSLKTEKNIEGVTIRGVTKKGAENNLINLQRKSVEIIETVGSEQLTKQGVGDVAAAVTKATGTIKQEGSKTISVRGLLDRYNTTTLNGLTIPSDDPENKNIDLSILKTDIIDYIAIEKVFSPRLSGDFGGANINIISKEHSGSPFFSINLSSSVNTQVFKTNKFLLQQGPNFWGFANIPTPSNSLTQYQVQNSWNFKDTFGGSNFTPINSGLDIEGGRTFNIGAGKLNTFFYAGFNNDYFYARGKEGYYNRAGERIGEFDVDRFNYATNTTALVNLFYKINAKNQLKATSNYIHSTEQDVKIFQGYHADWANLNNGTVRRALYKVTDLLINQLGGEHKFNDKLTLNWIAAYNILNSRQPDRMTNTLIYERENNYYRLRRDGGSSNRYFDDLKDNEASANIDFTYKLSDNMKVIAGYQGRYKIRNFKSQQYDFRYTDNYSTQNFTHDPNDVDFVLNNNRFNSGYFEIRSNYTGNAGFGFLTPMSFDGIQFINSGFANLDYKINDRLTALAGLRFDNIQQDLNWQVNYVFASGLTSIKNNYQKFLPSLNFKYEINDKQNLKLSASRTYTMPQLKEMAPYYYDNISESTVGNVFLKPSDNNNIDLKWELFPNKGELVSLTGYGKYIQNPISKALISEGTYSYLNVGNYAYVWGIEAEFRKDLIKGTNKKLYTFLNASYLNSRTQLDSQKILRETRNTFSSPFDVKQEQLQEAASLIGNASLGYNQKWSRNNMDFVVSYAYVGDNLYAVSTNMLGNVIQKAIHTLDANLRFEFGNNMTLSFNAKNLINPTIEREQMTTAAQRTITYQYKRGREIGVGIGYKF